MDNFPAGCWGEAYRTSVPAAVYRQMLREIGALDTMAGKSRRHLVCSPDTWAPGEKRAPRLPRDCPAGGRVAFAIPTGPAARGRQRGQVRLAAEPRETTGLASWEVFVNGAQCRDAGDVTPFPDVTEPLHAFSVPAGAMQWGENLIEVQNSSPTAERLVWVELAVSDRDGKWPSSGVQVTTLYPGLGG